MKGTLIATIAGVMISIALLAGTPASSKAAMIDQLDINLGGGRNGVSIGAGVILTEASGATTWTVDALLSGNYVGSDSTYIQNGILSVTNGTFSFTGSIAGGGSGTLISGLASVTTAPAPTGGYSVILNISSATLGGPLAASFSPASFYNGSLDFTVNKLNSTTESGASGVLSQVPIPSAFLLFGAGLFALAGIRKRFKG